MDIDPSFLKIWYAWVKWMNDIPYWDPYGAAASMALSGFALGFLLWKVLNEN